MKRNEISILLAVMLHSQASHAGAGLLPDLGPFGTLMLVLAWAIPILGALTAGAFLLYFLARSPRSRQLLAHARAGLEQGFEAAHRFRYVISLLAMSAWVGFFSVETGSLPGERSMTAKGWTLFVGITVACGVVPLLAARLFSRE